MRKLFTRRIRRVTRSMRWSDATLKHGVRRTTRTMHWSDATLKHGVEPVR